MVISANKIHQQADWTDRRLADLAAFEKGHVVTYQSDSVTGSRPYIGADSFTGVFNQFTMDSAAVLCEPTDVLMLWDGERSGLCATGLCGAIGSTVTRLRPKIGIDRRFLYHQLARHFAWIQARRTGTGIPHVPKDIGNTLFLPLPSDPAEQSRIAAVLDTIDEAIAKTEAVIAKLKQVRAGLLHDLLTRGLDENGQLRDPIAHPEQFQDSPIGRIPKAWDVLPLGSIATVDRGKFAHRPRNDPAFYGGGFPFIQTGDIALVAGEIITEASQTLNSRGVSVSREFSEGTIAVTIAANIGDTAILGRPMFFPDSIVGVVPIPMHINRWIELTLRDAKKRLNALAPQSAQKNINLEFLRPLLVPVPSSSEQKLCVQVYENITASISTEHHVLVKLSFLKSALMADLLTGRVRVPEYLFQEERTP